jgi:hypothetical protein
MLNPDEDQDQPPGCDFRIGWCRRIGDRPRAYGKRFGFRGVCTALRSFAFGQARFNFDCQV